MTVEERRRKSGIFSKITRVKPSVFFLILTASRVATYPDDHMSFCCLPTFLYLSVACFNLA